jgi:drug/metabolite transporter (DMT)-like permease
MIVLAYIICQYAVNMLLLTAFDNLDTGIYAGFSSISVLFSLLIGYYVLNEKITKQKMLGVVVVLIGIALNIYGRTTIES